MPKFVLPTTRNPNASQWNIGCVGSPGIGACVGHVHFMLFVPISFALGSQRECSFQWNMGYTFHKGSQNHLKGSVAHLQMFQKTDWALCLYIT